MAAVIRKLDEAVVNRIAAGEVIQRPANAIKEMIENCIDAKSSNIQVTVKEGGLKLIQIVDNGCGIRKDDLEIVCERFTTSKLSTFEDLTSIATFGFRGEALASISHVAHLTLITKTADSKCAYKGTYCDGKLSAPVKPFAGNNGTQILVEDLFYNVTTRRKSLKSATEEYHRIAEVISKYAIHNSPIAFSLKKKGEGTADVRTPGSVTIPDNIKAIYGPSIAKELLEVTGANTKLSYKVSGYVTNANYSLRKGITLLFINNRLVDSPGLRKAIDLVFSPYLPKHTFPFVYLSLQIAPQNVDVNVHPTKHEVHFLHEDAIISDIQKCVETRLLGSNASRTFYTNALLPSVKLSNVTGSDKPSKAPANSAAGQTYAYHMVRTDNREQKLDKFLKPITSQPGVETTKTSDVMDNASTPLTSAVPSRCEGNATVDPMDVDFQQDKSNSTADTPRNSTSGNSTVDTPRREVKLTSVIRLKEQVKDRLDQDAKDMMKKHTFVGCVDREFSLMQHQTSLYLVNMTKLTSDLFYQIMLLDFGNFGFLKLSDPATVFDISMLALDLPQSGWSPDEGPKEELASYIQRFLLTKAEMLLDYFSIEIDESGHLLSLPLLLEGYIPTLDHLPLFIIRLVTEVDWEEEESCFDSICREMARFYALQTSLFPNCTLEEDKANNPQPWKWTVEHVLFPKLRTLYQPPKERLKDGSLLRVANLHDLYKVFERC